MKKQKSEVYKSDASDVGVKPAKKKAQSISDDSDVPASIRLPKKRGPKPKPKVPDANLTKLPKTRGPSKVMPKAKAKSA
jgi:hypothetical protein